MDAALRIIGRVRSPLTDRKTAPKQNYEGGIRAEIAVAPTYIEALEGLEPGDEILLFTWLHLAGRDTLRVHPRGDAARPKRGVFSTRSPNRPNPIGLHKVEIIKVSPDGILTVEPLEAIDGTPVVDIKPVLPHPKGI